MPLAPVHRLRVLVLPEGDLAGPHLDEAIARVYVKAPSIEGLDEDVAAELQSRATEALERRESGYREARRALGVEDALAEIPGLTEEMLVRLGQKGIRTLDDLADLATDELIGKGDKRREIAPGFLASFNISLDDGNAIIMAARKHWFDEEESAV